MRLPFPSERLLPPAGFLVVLIVWGAVLMSGLVNAFDQKILDAGFKLNRRWFLQPVSTDVVVVGIDEAFAESVDEPLAVSHAYLADFLRAVSQAEPKVIGIDLVLPDKRFNTLSSAKQPDLDFHKTLLAGLLQARQHTTLIVAKVWDKNHSHYKEIQLDYAMLLDMQGDAVQTMASAIFCPDADGVVRAYPSYCQPDHGKHTFAGEIAAAMGQRQDWRGLINYQLGHPFAYVPMQKVLRAAAQGDTGYLKQHFAGKAVLLGVILDDTDLLPAPAPLLQGSSNLLVPGVLVHAQALRSMLNQGLIQHVPSALSWLLCALFASFWFGKSVLVKLPILIMAMACLLLACELLLWRGYWLPPAGMLAAGLLSFGARSALQGWRHFRDKQRLGRIFSGYVSPGVMKEIINGSLDASRAGRKTSVCVLFSDIRNFTSMSEHLPAEDVVSLLNRYFARMTKAIHQHGGTVDKFIGDGMMAFFGAPNHLDRPEKNALAASRDMLIALAELNREFAAEGRAPFQIGIGLHSGAAVIGHIGSPERHEYTAIGDAVNTASRIEGLCKELGYPVVCSALVAQSADSPVTLVNLGKRSLKGRSPVVVYGWKPEDKE